MQWLQYKNMSRICKNHNVGNSIAPSCYKGEAQEWTAKKSAPPKGCNTLQYYFKAEGTRTFHRCEARISSESPHWFWFELARPLSKLRKDFRQTIVRGHFGQSIDLNIHKPNTISTPTESCSKGRRAASCPISLGYIADQENQDNCKYTRTSLLTSA